MNGKDNTSVPFIAYEAEQFRHEKTVKRLIAVIIAEALAIIAVSIGLTCSASKYINDTSQSTSAIAENYATGSHAYSGIESPSPEESRRKTKVSVPKRGG